MSVVAKAVSLFVAFFGGNGEKSYVLVSVLAAVVIPVLIWLYVRKIFGPRGANPFAQDSRRSPEPLERDLKEREKVLKNGFVAKKVPEKLDAIVVGSGIGGLSCAAILAKAGKKVLVLEQHDQAGGCCHTFYEKGFEFDTGIHYIGEMFGNTSSKFLVDQLTEGQLSWSSLDETYDEVIIGPNPQKSRMFPIMSKRENYKKALLDKFPEEGNAISKYLELLKDCRKNIFGQIVLRIIPKKIGQFLVSTGIIHWMTSYFQYAQRSLAAVTEEITNNRDLRAVLSYNFGDYGTAPKDGSFAIHAALANHFMNGGFYPVGGASEIAMHFIPVIEKSGGRVLVRAPVKQILVDEEKRKVLGVRVAKSSGDVDIHAPLVVSGAGVYNTFEKLLPASYLDKDIRSMLGSVRHGVGGLSVYIGLNASHEELGIIPRNQWIFSNNELDRSYEEFCGLPAEDAGKEDIPLLFLSFPSAKDPSWSERFPGKSTCAIITLAPYEWFQHWKDGKVMHRGRDYDELKHRIAKRMWEQVCRFHPKLKDKVEYFDVGSPLSNQYYIAASRGELYGADHNLERFTPQSTLNLRATTSIKGLFLTGQDILCCGFSGGLHAGLLCATAILKRNVFGDLNALRKRCSK